MFSSSDPVSPSSDFSGNNMERMMTSNGGDWGYVAHDHRSYFVEGPFGAYLSLYPYNC